MHYWVTHVSHCSVTDTFKNMGEGQRSRALKILGQFFRPNRMFAVCEPENKIFWLTNKQRGDSIDSIELLRKLF